MTDTQKRRALVVRPFKDEGTGASYKKGATPLLDAGVFGNYKAAGLVDFPPVTKAATATKSKAASKSKPKGEAKSKTAAASSTSAAAQAAAATASGMGGVAHSPASAAAIIDASQSADVAN